MDLNHAKQPQHGDQGEQAQQVGENPVGFAFDSQQVFEELLHVRSIARGRKRNLDENEERGKKAPVGCSSGRNDAP